jgi:hypothetical protein
MAGYRSWMVRYFTLAEGAGLRPGKTYRRGMLLLPEAGRM